MTDKGATESGGNLAQFGVLDSPIVSIPRGRCLTNHLSVTLNPSFSVSSYGGLLSNN
jgi:hypothetical protein